VQQLTSCQSALYAFIASLLGGVEHAGDVLQETNVSLCRRAADYDAAQPFLRWAYAFARFEVMAWRKRQERSRLVFDDELVALLAAELEEPAERAERQLAALEGCLERLPQKQREVIQARYAEGEAVQDIARRMARPENAVAALLYRIRKALAECMEAALSREETA
jgi:RNA polymerase sigma-70 factor (ECF subfamily)